MCSRGKEDLKWLWDFLATLDHVSQNLKGDRLHLSHRVFLGGTVGHYAGKVRYGCQDSAILLLFNFDPDWLNLNHVYATL
jgi:hypothetical protein